MFTRLSLEPHSTLLPETTLFCFPETLTFIGWFTNLSYKIKQHGSIYLGLEDEETNE